MKKGFLGCIMLISVVLVLALLSVSAAVPERRVIYMTAGETAEAVMSSEKAEQMPDADFSGPWRFTEEGVRASKVELDGISVLRFSVRENLGDEGLYVSFDQRILTNGADTVYIPLIVEGAGEEIFRIMVETKSGERTYYAPAYAETGQWQLYAVDISGLPTLDSLSIRVMGVSHGRTVHLAPVFLGNGERGAHILQYCTADFFYTGTATDHRVFSGNGELAGDFVYRAEPVRGTEAYLLVTLSGEVNGGTVTLGLRNMDGSWTDSAPQRIRGGRQVYAFPFTAEEQIAYRLSFRGVTADEDGVYVESVALIRTEKSLFENGCGYVSSIAVDGESGRLIIRGSLSRAVATEHGEDELVLYAVPMARRISETDDVRLWGGTALTRSRVFMNFELIVDAALTARYAGTHRFYVCVESKEEIHPPQLLSLPRGVDSVMDGMEKEMSPVGIDGAAAVSVFESNASHVIVDLPFDRLVPDRLPKNGVRISAADGASIFVDGDYLEEITAEVDFYRSANILVYFRLTDERHSFAEGVMAFSEERAEIFAALLRAVLDSDKDGFPTAAGLILGEGERWDGAVPLVGYMEQLARVIGVMHSVFASYGTGETPAVILPFVSGDAYGSVIHFFLSRSLMRMGEVPWTLMLCFDVESPDLFEEADMLLSAGDSEGGGADGLILFFEPDRSGSAESIMLTYNNLCDDAAVYEPKAVFLTLERFSDEQKELICRRMKNIRNAETNSIVESLDAEMLPRVNTESVYTVWDFGDLYHSDGWIAGGTISGCGTGRSVAFSEERGISTRALQAEVYPDYRNGMASAIVLRNFRRPMDWSVVDDLILRFTVDETTENATVVIFLGNEQMRAEYVLNEVTPGEIHTVRCPLSSYSGRGEVTYVGAMVYASDSAMFEIGQVHLAGENTGADGIAALFAEPAQPPVDNSKVVYAMMAFVCVITVFMIAAMLRRDREEMDNG